MNQSLHILKKDARHFWWEILVVLIFTTMFAVVLFSPIVFGFVASRRALPGNQDGRLSVFPAIALTLAWYYLIAIVVREEALGSDIPFWVTRPYNWKRLLASKIAFVAIFINL